MRETQTPHFYDFGILEVQFGTHHQAPKPTIFIFGDTRILQKETRKTGTFLQHILFINLIFWKSRHIKFREDARRKMV